MNKINNFSCNESKEFPPGFDVVFGAILILVITVLVLNFYAPVYHKNNYLEGKQIVENITFDDLQTSMLKDGTKIKVAPSPCVLA